MERFHSPNQSGAVPTPDPSPDTEDAALRQALLEGVRGNLHLVAGGLAVLYVLLALGHLLVLPPPLKIPMTVTAALSALGLGWSWRSLRRHPPPLARAYPIALAIAGVVMVNSALHLYLSAEPQHTTNLVLLLIGLGYFLVSPRWYAASVALVILVWGGVVWAVGPLAPAGLWVHFGFALLTGTVVATLIQVAHNRNLRRLELLRLRNERKNAALVREVEQRHRTERALRERQAELAHVGRLNLAGEMASGLAHELNQPLAAIALYAQVGHNLMQLETANRQRLEEILAKINDQSQRAGQIIHRMKYFTRAAPPQRQVLDLNALVQDTLGFAEYDLNRTSVRVDLELEADLPPVEADPIQLQQVLLNLLRNAQEAVQELPPEQRAVLITTRTLEDGGVELGVADLGPGLPPEAMARLFQPFFTTKVEGTGLGLSISKSLIDSHGGKMWVAPRPQRGMIFGFTLPRPTARPELAMAATGPGTGAGSPGPRPGPGAG